MTTTAPSMSDRTALLRSIGVRLSGHARLRAAERGFSVREILLAVGAPEVHYMQHRYGPGREVRQRGELGIVLDIGTLVVITVLWRDRGRWLDSDVAPEVRAA